MKKITWQDKTIAGATLAIALANQLVGQYIIQGIIYVYETIMLQSDYIMIFAMGIILIAIISRNIDQKKEYNIKLSNLKNKKSDPKFLE